MTPSDDKQANLKKKKSISRITIYGKSTCASCLKREAVSRSLGSLFFFSFSTISSFSLSGEALECFLRSVEKEKKKEEEEDRANITRVFSGAHIFFFSSSVPPSSFLLPPVWTILFPTRLFFPGTVTSGRRGISQPLLSGIRTRQLESGSGKSRHSQSLEEEEKTQPTNPVGEKSCGRPVVEGGSHE